MTVFSGQRWTAASGVSLDRNPQPPRSISLSFGSHGRRIANAPQVTGSSRLVPPRHLFMDTSFCPSRQPVFPKQSLPLSSRPIIVIPHFPSIPYILSTRSIAARFLASPRRLWNRTEGEIFASFLIKVFSECHRVSRLAPFSGPPLRLSLFQWSQDLCPDQTTSLQQSTRLAGGPRQLMVACT
jgi:hypothetical protein